jgi:hypothetical protein
LRWEGDGRGTCFSTRVSLDGKGWSVGEVLEKWPMASHASEETT